jgi:signal transduction histidine kinase
MTEKDSLPLWHWRQEPGAIGPLWVDPAHHRHLVWLSAIVAVVSFTAWTAEQQLLVLSTWTQSATPVLCFTLLVNALVLDEFPRWGTRMSLLSAGASSIFLLGMLIQNLHRPELGPEHAMFYFGCVSPIFYPAVFAVFTHGAALLCWLHFAALATVLGLSVLWPGPPLHPGVGEVKLLVLFLHPCAIVALSFLVRMRHEASAKERAAHKNKEQMLAMISHEIRSPLQTMLSSVDLLSAKVTDAVSTRALGRLSAVTQQLDRHLRDLVEFTRLDNPELAIEMRPYDLITLIDTLLDEQQAAFDAKGLTLARPDWSHISPGANKRWRKAMGDPERVRQVLANLITNAQKYTPHGTVSVYVVPHPERLDCAQIDIKDTGAGIAADQLARIFEPFVRLTPTDGPRIEGSGLGLAIAARLIQRMGGSIRAHSTLGHGSHFEVCLPLHP